MDLFNSRVNKKSMIIESGILFVCLFFLNTIAIANYLYVKFGFILRHAGFSVIEQFLPKKEVETIEIRVMVKISI